MINSRQFVLEASYIISRDGTRNSVPSGLNYIMVDSAQAVVQSGDNAGMGLNDVGGVTASGNITSWKVYKNEKKMTFTIQMGVSTNLGLINMSVHIPARGMQQPTFSEISNYPVQILWDPWFHSKNQQFTKGEQDMWFRV